MKNAFIKLILVSVMFMSIGQGAAALFAQETSETLKAETHNNQLSPLGNGGNRATPPESKKELTDNGDGTYTLSLSVTGTASSVTTSNKADVIVVLDTSGSMNNTTGGITRLAAAKQAVNSLAAELLSNNNAEHPDRVQLSLVTFATNANTRITGTTSLSGFQNTVNSLTAVGGTNWEDALMAANNIAVRQDSHAYVIFVSDGNPTFWINNDGSVGGNGYETTNNIATSYNQALPVAQAIVAAGKTLYSIGAFGSVDRMQNLAVDSGAGLDKYYSVADQAALNAAFSTIINEITNALGYCNISITDGLTAMTATTLVAGQPSGFTYTKTAGGVETAWNDAPAAVYDGSAVSWNLGDMQLEHNVTYKVSFKVWPSQAAYDLLADLNNGFVNYDDLTEEQKSQIVPVAGSYGLKTNTVASLSYTQVETITTRVLPDGATYNPVDGTYSHDGFIYTQNPDGSYTGTKETSGTTAFTEPSPMPLKGDTLTIKKAWNDSLDEDDRPGSVTLRVVRDDNTYAEVTLNEGNGWSSTINIAPGVTATNISSDPLEPGHDYRVEEVDGDYHYELDANVFHPMLVDGVMTPEYENGANVTITNHLKGGLNIKKAVTAAAGLTAPDAEFRFQVTLTKADGSPWTAGSYNGTIDDNDLSYLKYRIYYKDGTVSEKFMIKSGDIITLKDGDNARIINIPSGTTYSVSEVDIPVGFTLASSTNTSGTIQHNTGPEALFTNNYSLTPARASIPVTKKLVISGGSGPGDITGKYTFTLTADNNAPLPATTTYTNPNANGGTVTFGEIEFTQPGTYTYHVEETGTVNGVVNDTQSTKTITIVVVDNGDGTLKATVNGATEGTQTVFTNTYNVQPTTATIPVKKTLSKEAGLTGPDITEAFTFRLTAADGKPLPAVTELKNPAADGGVVTFGDITYNNSGTYTYTVTESGTVAGISNDSTASKTVTVVVADNGDGTLTATVSSTVDNPLTFTNTYAVAPAEAVITAKKVLKNAELTQGAFNFELSAAADTPMPASANATNDADGSISFGKITYNKPGTYTYTIKETAGSAAYYTYDLTEYTVTVTVTDNGDGTMTAAVSGAGDTATFTNTYKAESDEVTITAEKQVNGVAPSVNIFQFTLTADDGGKLPDQTTVTNNGGSVSFGPIKYDASIFADMPAASGQVTVTFDPAAITADALSVQLLANGVASGDAVAAVKDAEGNWAPVTWKDQPKADGEGNAIAYTVSYVADGNDAVVADATVQDQPVQRVKVFHYTISELAGSAAGYTYDTGNTEGVTVTVTDNGDGTLSAAVEYDDDDVVFKNTYAAAGSAIINANKVVTGNTLQAGQFKFGLYEGGVLVAEAGNEASGAISFTVSYDQSQTGTHNYTMKEISETQLVGYTYDSSVKNITVSVTDNGDGTLAAAVSYADDMTFTNTYQPLPTEVVLTAKKVLDGRTLKDGEFTFDLLDSEGNHLTSASNTADGKVEFAAQPLTAAGTYTYKVSEKEGSTFGMAYDSTVFVYEVKVEDVAGRLTVTSINVIGAEEVVFTNVFTKHNPHVTIDKHALNVPAGGYHPGDVIEYEIIVTNDGDTVLTNLVIVDPLTGNTWTLDELEIGASVTYTTSYTTSSSDVLQGQGKVVNTVTVEADTPDPDNPKVSDEDDDVQKVAEKSPQTSDDGNLGLWTFMMSVSLAATVYVLSQRRKYGLK